ncbi:MAG: hypothetical protein ACK4NR_10820 [Micavibrio sp.]
MKYKGLIIACFLVAACSHEGPARDYHPYLASKGISSIAPDAIPHCHGYGCRLHSTVSLEKSEWKQVGQYFKTGRDAVQERDAIAKAIGTLETLVGKKAGTDTDIAGTYRTLGNDQHDCVDESVNTTVYLSLLQQKNLLKHHDISTISTRIPLFGGGLGFHQTAVIVEKETGQRYAVDSWFHDNGHAAAVIPLADWIYGWDPPKGK